MAVVTKNQKISFRKFNISFRRNFARKISEMAPFEQSKEVKRAIFEAQQKVVMQKMRASIPPFY